MKNKRNILIGRKTMSREELFAGQEKFRKVRARLPFEEKIKALIDLQKVAYGWGKKKDVMIWTPTHP